jgi:secreted Zn-dependent insulinase-like peptidase
LTKQVFYCSLAHLFAGLTYTLKPTKTGFELTAKGYNEKMPKFLLTIVDAIYALDLSEGWTKVLSFYLIVLILFEKSLPGICY